MPTANVLNISNYCKQLNDNNFCQKIRKKLKYSLNSVQNWFLWKKQKIFEVWKGWGNGGCRGHAKPKLLELVQFKSQNKTK